jgi:Glycosyltransferase family 87
VTLGRRGRLALTIALGAALFAGCAALPNVGLFDSAKDGDTGLYEDYADAVLAGEVPYRDFFVVYPPGALPVFVAPALVGGNYELAFKLLAILLGVTTVALVVWLLDRLGLPPARQIAAAALVGLSPVALGMPVIANYDLWPALLTTAALAGVVAGRERLGLAALGVAATAKVYPAALLPLLFLYVRRRTGARAAWLGVAAFAVAIAAIVLPFALASPGGVRYSFSVAAQRGLQLESLPSSVLLAADQVGLWEEAHVEHYLDSQNVAGGPLPGHLARLSPILQAAAVLLVLVLFARLRPRAETLLLASAATVTGVVAFGKVLSPQFLIWLVPLFALLVSRRTLAAVALFAAALVLTQLWWPTRFLELLELGDVVWLVVVRNVLLVALFALLVVMLRRGGEDAVLTARRPGAFARTRDDGARPAAG